MQDTVQTTPATFTAQEPAAEPRTITYPLRTGGSLTSVCPDWCTSDHSDDVARGINPTDLLHQGDKIGLEYSADGIDMSILEARIIQWPFDPEDSSPYVELVPEGRTAVGLTCASPLALDEEIRKVRGHLRALEELADQLAEAKAAEHALDSRGDLTPWASIGRTDLLSMPIAYLLKVFGVTVVETEDIGRKAVLALYGEPGAMELRVKADVPQQLREDETRRALLARHDAQFGGDRV
ncbi:DUF6907 domain-containing protein [Streptomyces mirabilis]|uniref:DUF6907 domain-containing protein n=1 Tax=Streptomyces mirabilis TaxID=68239 RepID=UPI0033A2685C